MADASDCALALYHLKFHVKKIHLSDHPSDIIVYCVGVDFLEVIFSMIMHFYINL